MDKELHRRQARSDIGVDKSLNPAHNVVEICIGLVISSEMVLEMLALIEGKRLMRVNVMLVPRQHWFKFTPSGCDIKAVLGEVISILTKASTALSRYLHLPLRIRTPDLQAYQLHSKMVKIVVACRYSRLPLLSQLSDTVDATLVALSAAVVPNLWVNGPGWLFVATEDVRYHFAACTA